MMQMIRGSTNTMLFLSREAVLAPPADAADEPDPDQATDLNRQVFALDGRADGDDATDALVSECSRQLDVGDVLAVGTGGCAVLRVQV